MYSSLGALLLRALLLVIAFVCFIVAAIGLPANGGGRPVLTWLAAGLAFLTASLLIDAARLRQ
jgi:hypothetical protein